MKIGELFLDIGIIGDSNKVVAINTAVTALNTSFISLKESINIAYVALDKIIDKSTQYALSFNNFNQQTDLSVTKLREWQIAATTANAAMNMDEVTSSIQNLQSNLAQIQLGKGNINPFAMLGIVPWGKDAFKVLDELRLRIKYLKSPIAIDFMQQMGLSPNFINVLRLTDDQMKKFKNTLFLTQQQSKDLLLLSSNINALKIGIMNLFATFMAKLSPLLNNEITKALKFINKNANKIISVMDMIIKMADILISSISRLISAAIKFKEVTAAIIAIASGMTIFNLLLNPVLLTITLISAGLAGLLLLFDDLNTYLTGGKALFAPVYDFIKDFKFPTINPPDLSFLQNFKWPDFHLFDSFSSNMLNMDSTMKELIKAMKDAQNMQYRYEPERSGKENKISIAPGAIIINADSKSKGIEIASAIQDIFSSASLSFNNGGF